MSDKKSSGVSQERRPGREYVDPTPVEWPLGVGVPESLEQKIARMVRTSVSAYASAQGHESFEEADDFDVEDPEALPGSSHELDDDQEAIMRDQEAVRRIPRQFREAFEREQERRRAAAAASLQGAPGVSQAPQGAAAPQVSQDPPQAAPSSPT